MGRNIIVSEAMGQFIDDIPVEFVERKGIGHPLDQPLMATAAVHLKNGGLTPAVCAHVEAVIDEHLQHDPLRIRARIASGELKMF